MRRDHVFNIILALATLVGGAAIAAAYGVVTDPAHAALWRWLAVIGFVLMTLGLLAVVGIAVGDREEREAIEGRRKMIPLIGMTVCGLGLIGFAAWYFWPTEKHTVVAQNAAPPEQHYEIKTTQSAVATAKIPATASVSPHTAPNLDNTIAFRCNFSAAPTHWREDKPLWTTQIIGPPDPAAPLPWANAANTFFVQGNQPINWGGEEPNQFYRCTFTNYGPNPVFAVSIETSIIWLNVINTDNGVKSGAIIAVRKFMLPTVDLGVGVNNQDYFYIYSRSKTFIQLVFPTTVSARTADGSEIKNIKLIQNSDEPFMPVFFNPVPTVTPKN
jgi:hypothetical protein